MAARTAPTRPGPSRRLPQPPRHSATRWEAVAVSTQVLRVGARLVLRGFGCPRARGVRGSLPGLRPTPPRTQVRGHEESPLTPRNQTGEPSSVGRLLRAGLCAQLGCALHVEGPGSGTRAGGEVSHGGAHVGVGKCQERPSRHRAQTRGFRSVRVASGSSRAALVGTDSGLLEVKPTRFPSASCGHPGPSLGGQLAQHSPRGWHPCSSVQVPRGGPLAALMALPLQGAGRLRGRVRSEGTSEPLTAAEPQGASVCPFQPLPAH